MAEKLANEYDVTVLTPSELQTVADASITVTRAHLAIVIVNGKPYTATVGNIQDAA